jgi:hypothetical protein
MFKNRYTRNSLIQTRKAKKIIESGFKSGLKYYGQKFNLKILLIKNQLSIIDFLF